MVNNIHANFLEDVEAYRASEQYWRDLWARVDLDESKRSEWFSPWVSTGSAECRDGNPIFSACSRSLRRGIRVIQDEPESDRLDIQVWLDRFVAGADGLEVDELVVACTLSEEAAAIALFLMNRWAANLPLILENSGENGIKVRLLPSGLLGLAVGREPRTAA